MRSDYRRMSTGPDAAGDLARLDLRDLTLEVRDRVAVITLDRPEQRNAFTGAMGDSLGRAYAHCDVDDEVRVVVPPRARLSHWRQLVQTLSELEAGSGTAAEPALRRVVNQLRRRGLVVFVSDLLLDRELALKALRFLRHRGHQVLVLHIMDPGTREDTHNPWVIGFGIAALLTTILALVMLPLTIRRRRNGNGR